MRLLISRLRVRPPHWAQFPVHPRPLGPPISFWRVSRLFRPGPFFFFSFGLFLRGHRKVGSSPDLCRRHQVSSALYAHLQPRTRMSPRGLRNERLMPSESLVCSSFLLWDFKCDCRLPRRLRGRHPASSTPRLHLQAHHQPRQCQERQVPFSFLLLLLWSLQDVFPSPPVPCPARAASIECHRFHVSLVAATPNVKENSILRSEAGLPRPPGYVRRIKQVYTNEAKRRSDDTPRARERAISGSESVPPAELLSPGVTGDDRIPPWP